MVYGRGLRVSEGICKKNLDIDACLKTVCTWNLTPKCAFKGRRSQFRQERGKRRYAALTVPHAHLHLLPTQALTHCPPNAYPLRTQRSPAV